MATEYADQVGARLRSIRQQRGLSLHAVEEKSQGRWKAVVVGSYERGDRAVSVPKLAELAGFYGVPVVELLPDAGGRSGMVAERRPKLTLDVERLGEIEDAEVAPLARYAASIQSVRGDYNGKVLSLRKEDLRTLAAVYDWPVDSLTAQLVDWGVVDDEAVQLVAEDA